MPSAKPPTSVRIAVIGGSGIYEIEGMKVLRRVHPTTPFGKPSDPITIGDYHGIRCAFLPVTSSTVAALERDGWITRFRDDRYIVQSAPAGTR